MTTNRRRNGLIAALSAGCLVLAGTTAWALATRGSQDVSTAPAADQEIWVSPDGQDAGSGARDDPFATIQHAVDQATPGTTVFVRGGTYAQRVDFTTSGEPGRPVVLTAAPGEEPVLDGSTLDVPSGQDAMVTVDGSHDIAVEALTITGYRSDENGHVPIGIFVTGESGAVRLTGNRIQDLGTTFQGRNGGDAHGIAVYGTSSTQPISGLVIEDNELSDLDLGSSEALVLNGNVKDFLVAGNRVHDTNNIGIDVIGFEGTASDPTVDQARDGVVRDNEVWNIDSRGNPAYGNDGSADGIYVDGGRDVLIEANVVHDVNIGIELASEHTGRSTRNITVRNNVVYDTTTIGVAIGGYDRRRGSTEECTLVNNTVFRSDGPALLVQFDTRGNLIENNIFVSGAGHEFVQNPYPENVDNLVDYNLYWAEDGSSDGTWQWKGTQYRTFPRWVGDSGNDRHSQFADPLFADPALGDFSLRAESPAIDAGMRLAQAGATDLAGVERSQGPFIDIGAFESPAPEPTPTPEISGTAAYLSELPWLTASNGWGPPEADQSNGERPAADGLPLQIGSTTFEHGIGVHAPSLLVVAVPAGCSLFLSDVGLDEEVGSQGSVVFEVWGDKKLLASSGLVLGTDESVPLSADVSDVQRLSLVVTRGGDGNAFDHADWGDARLDCASG